MISVSITSFYGETLLTVWLNVSFVSHNRHVVESWMGFLRTFWKKTAAAIYKNKCRCWGLNHRPGIIFVLFGSAKKFVYGLMKILMKTVKNRVLLYFCEFQLGCGGCAAWFTLSRFVDRRIAADCQSDLQYRSVPCSTVYVDSRLRFLVMT